MIVGGLLVLALFAALIGPYFIDWTSYRTAFEREASRALGQPVEVRGAADARLLPFPSVTFGDVAIGRDQDGRPLMTVANFSMDAELAPFLSGEIRIFDMRLEEPSVRLRIEPDGTLDWALSRKPAAPGDTVVLENVTITDGEILVVDAQNGRQHRISDLDATLSARSLAGPYRIQGSATMLGRHGSFDLATGEVTGDGRIPLRTRLTPQNEFFTLELEGNAGIVDAKPRYDGSFTLRITGEDAAPAAGEGMALPAVATGAFEADNERLRVPEYRMQFGGGDNPYIVTGEATIDTGPEPDFLLIADGRQVNFNAAREAQAGGESPAAPPVSAGERLRRLNGLLANLPPPPLPGRVEISLPAVLLGGTTIREVAIAARPQDGRWHVDRFSANLPGRTTVEASGVLTAGEAPEFAGELVVASNQASGLANWLTGSVDPVIRRIGQTGFSAQVHLTRELQRFVGLEIAIGPAILKGTLERQSLAGQPPSLSLDLAGDRFDIDAVRALSALAGLGGMSETGNAFGVGNLSAHIAADTLTVNDLSIGEVETTMLVREGTLTIDRFSFGDLAGASGSVSGELSGSVLQPVGQLSGSLTAENADALLALAARLAPDNTTIARLRRNAGAFDGLEARFLLSRDESAGAAIELQGVAGGSDFTFSAGGEGLMIGPAGDRRFVLKAENDTASRLAEQAGFAVLPFGEAGTGRLDLSMTMPANGAGEINLSALIGETEIGVAGRGSLPANGRLTGDFDITLASPNIEPALVMFGQPLPRTGLGRPAHLTSRLKLTEETVTFSQLSGTVGRNALSADLAFDRAAAGLSATGSVTATQVDLEWLSEWVLGPRGAFPSESGEDAPWSDAPFLPPMEGTPAFDIDLGASQVNLSRGGEATGFTGHVVLEPGRLSVTDMRADWNGGTLSGEFHLDNPDGNVFLSAGIEVAGADLTAIELAIAEQAPVSGRLDLSLRAEGAGKSMSELVGSLTGGGEMIVENAIIENVDTGAFDEILAAVDVEEFEIEAPAVARIAEEAISDDAVELDRLPLPFTLANGVQRFANFQVAMDDATLSGEGRIDLRDFTLAARLALVFEPRLEAQAGADPRVTIALSGPVADPVRNIDATALTNFLSVRAYERERRKVELLQAGVLEKQRLRRVLDRVVEAERERAEAKAAEDERLRRQEAERRAREAAEQAAAAERERREAEARQRAAEEAAARQAAEERRQEEELRQSAPTQEEQDRAAREREMRRIIEGPAGERRGDEAAGAEGGASGDPAPSEAPASEPQPAAPAEDGGALPRLDFEALPGVRRF